LTGEALPRFDRKFFDGTEPMTVIGSSSIGGKARGLVEIRRALQEQFPAASFAGIELAIPTLTVIATEFFDEFLQANRLADAAGEDEPDRDIARRFQQASLPVELLGDLRALISKVHTPLAVRSSSLLEDALHAPFAGVYATKMIPNNQYDPDYRFRKLTEAIKYVYASTHFRSARQYIRAAAREGREEKMAVIIQEVIGLRHRDRFYPQLSGVARSYNFYPTGHGRPEDGVVSLALGLGKTIVDGGLAWAYSPAWPKANPPYNDLRGLLKQTQTRFWAVNMGPAPEYDPLSEREFLVECGIETAEEDETIGLLASTYDMEADRLVGHIGRPGPRVLTFAPILVSERVPLAGAIRELIACCKRALGIDVEIEFGATFAGSQDREVRLGFLQVRPMMVSREAVEIRPEDLEADDALAASESALGNGVLEGIRDVVYVKPLSFDTARTGEVARELEAVNRKLLAEERPYLLIGFGRWGTSDPWLGIPVEWGQISGARAIVESSLPGCDADPSQGSHFFHNVTGFRVLYFSVKHTGRFPIDWEWLDRREAAAETPFLRHVRLESPLWVAVDGRSGRGLIRKSAPMSAKGDKERA
jgi:hypothetical protein